MSNLTDEQIAEFWERAKRHTIEPEHTIILALCSEISRLDAAVKQLENDAHSRGKYGEWTGGLVDLGS